MANKLTINKQELRYSDLNHEDMVVGSTSNGSKARDRHSHRLAFKTEKHQGRDHAQ